MTTLRKLDTSLQVETEAINSESNKFSITQKYSRDMTTTKQMTSRGTTSIHGHELESAHGK